MYHVTLIRPPNLLPLSSVTTAQGVPPLGLAYVAASLRQAGYSVTIIDAFAEAPDAVQLLPGMPCRLSGLDTAAILSRIPRGTDAIGISCMFSNEWLYHRELVSHIAAVFPEKPVILGGEHATADPEHIFATVPTLTACILGEGEVTMPELLRAIARGAMPGTVPGVFGRVAADTTPVPGPLRPRVTEPDTLPRPAWDLVQLDTYFLRGLGYGAVTGRNMPMLASRGCPHNCAFCSNARMYQRQWHARSPQNVVSEICDYRDRFHVTHIEFYDLTMITSRTWIMEFIALLREQAPGLTWAFPTGTRTEALDPEVIACLARSGCRTLGCAPESGDQRTLRRIGKNIDHARMLGTLRDCVRNAVTVKVNIVTGFPDQTKAELFAGFPFYVRLALIGCHDLAVFAFVPYPGSRLHDMLVERGILDKASPDYDRQMAGLVYNRYTGMRSFSHAIPDVLLNVAALAAMALFYGVQFLLRPWRLWQLWMNVARQRPHTMLERALHGLWRTNRLLK